MRALSRHLPVHTDMQSSRFTVDFNGRPSQVVGLSHLISFLLQHLSLLDSCSIFSIRRFRRNKKALLSEYKCNLRCLYKFEKKKSKRLLC